MPYNPYNGNYYGDGSDIQTGSNGSPVMNNQTGSSQNSYGESAPSSWYSGVGSSVGGSIGSSSGSSSSGSSSSGGGSYYDDDSSSSSGGSTSSGAQSGTSNWGSSIIDTSNLSGYAKQWADAYNAQVQAGLSPSDNINHDYAQNTTDYDAIFQELQNQYGSGNVSYNDYSESAQSDYNAQLEQLNQMYPQLDLQQQMALQQQQYLMQQQQMQAQQQAWQQQQQALQSQLQQQQQKWQTQQQNYQSQINQNNSFLENYLNTTRRQQNMANQPNREQSILGGENQQSNNGGRTNMGASITTNQSFAIQRRLAGDMWANKSTGGM